MVNCGLLILIFITILGVYLGVLIQRPVSKLTESLKCPFCFGSDLCEEIEAKRINFRYQTFNDLFSNLISVKNVYYGDYKGTRVVIKKLQHNSEYKNLTGTLTSNFKLCGSEEFEHFINLSTFKHRLVEIMTILQVNVEPLMLSLLSSDDDWPVPEFYGSCGSIIVEKYCGVSLNHFQDSPWQTRALLALQLLEAAVNFTDKHDDFRVYLTDISPDNIAVGEDLRVCFVDLENVILKMKSQGTNVHYSEHFESEEGFVFSEDEICAGSISDHNIYATCALLLSGRAPWPMMPNGLLHSPPALIKESYGELFELVEFCVDSKFERFDVAKKIIELLKVINEIKF